MNNDLDIQPEYCDLDLGGNSMAGGKDDEEWEEEVHVIFNQSVVRQIRAWI